MTLGPSSKTILDSIDQHSDSSEYTAAGARSGNSKPSSRLLLQAPKQDDVNLRAVNNPDTAAADQTPQATGDKHKSMFHQLGKPTEVLPRPTRDQPSDGDAREEAELPVMANVKSEEPVPS